MYFALFLLMIVVFLVREKICNERRLNGIPIRIHVNGIRGKTSVTRLIAAALRESGIRTLAKITGDEPVLIYPDGKEEIIQRRGPVRIQEQIRFVKKAADLHAEAIVIECMALDPHLQCVSETQMIKSTVGVITNVRQDHMEIMGKSLDDIAEALSQTIPKKGLLVTSDERYFAFFKARAAERDTKAFLSENKKDECHQGNRGEPSVLRENILIADKVCSLVAIAASPAHGSLAHKDTDKTYPNIIIMNLDGKKLYFIDAFSANDIDSTRLIQQMTLHKTYFPRPYIALLNNRADRPLRMLSFLSYLTLDPTYDYVVLLGDNQRMAKKYIQRKGRTSGIIILKSLTPDKLLDEIYQQISSNEFTIVGMGNHKGLGGEVARFIQRRGKK
jgi:gamma-polyglutamate synthase